MPSVVRQARHAGVSFVRGEGVAHFWVDGLRREAALSGWSKALTARGLADRLSVGPVYEGALSHAFAELSPFVPLDVASKVLEEQSLSSADLEALRLAEINERADRSAFRRLHAEALRRGWPSLRAFFGTFPVTLVGVGRFARLFVMNAAPSVAPLALLAGSNKAVGRSVLRAHGLPVAPGAVAVGERACVAEARALGFPVVLKRPVSSNGDGVAPNLPDARAVRRAARLLGATTECLIVERMVVGVEYRLHFVNGRLHAMLEGEARTVTGDGQTPFIELVSRAEPGLVERWRSHPWLMRRLLLLLAGASVRDEASLRQFVPAAKARVPYTGAVGVGLLRSVSLDTLHAEDRSALEGFLDKHGRPSCAMDVIMAGPGRRLADGGAVLEWNVPCGSGYLDTPDDVASAELSAEVAGVPGFEAAGGRVPVTIVNADGERPDAALAGRLELEGGPGGGLRVLRPGGDFSWLGALHDPSAEAFLVLATEESLLSHGLPANLAPELATTLSPHEFSSRFPLFAALVKAAGGRLVQSA